MFVAKAYQYLTCFTFQKVPSNSKCSTSTFTSKHPLKPFLPSVAQPLVSPQYHPGVVPLAPVAWSDLRGYQDTGIEVDKIWKEIYPLTKDCQDCDGFKGWFSYWLLKKITRKSPPFSFLLNDAKGTNWRMLGKMDLQKFPSAMRAWRFFIQILGPAVVINRAQRISLGILRNLYLYVPWSKVAILGMVMTPLIGILIMGI